MTPNSNSNPPKLSAGAKTAARIQQVAVDLVLEHGIDGTTVEAICKAAEISERTFFYHFPTKESALIGIDLPTIDEKQAREFLAAPAGDIFTDAMALLPFQIGSTLDPSLMFKRLEMMQKNPALFSSHLLKLMSVRAEHMELIYLRLRRTAPSEMTDGQVREAAEFISEITASFLRTEMERVMRSGETPNPKPFEDVGSKIAKWVELGRRS